MKIATTYEVDNMPGRRKLASWQRRAHILENGDIYLPIIIVYPNEMAGYLALGWDGTSCVMEDRHVYASADWLLGEAKDEETRETIRRIVKRIRSTPVEP